MILRHLPKLKNRSSQKHNSAVLAPRSRHGFQLAKRDRTAVDAVRGPFVPPEIWYEPDEDFAGGYEIIEQSPGNGYRHVVTAAEIRERLARFPAKMLASLEVVQLSGMTRKKRSFPCYGMQWGNTLYLYPIETDLVEVFCQPPKPAQLIEARMYGGVWLPSERNRWRLQWTEETIKDFYLNNVLIHELGHLLDDRNTSYLDRERYAEWFAIEHGYKPSRRADLAKSAAKKVVRRHHAPR